VRVQVLVFAACAAACLVAHVAILVSTVRSRVRPDPESGVPRPNAVVEAFWALLPIVALAVVLTATWTRVRDHRDAAPAALMKIAQ
jgi:hypothetical protein